MGAKAPASLAWCCPGPEDLLMRIGLDVYTIDHRRLSAGAALEFARERGLEGLQFLDPTAIDTELRPGAMADFRRAADAMGLYVEVGLSCPNPVRRSRVLGRPVDVAEHARELSRQIEAIAALGCRHARAYVGDRHDRFRSDTPWKQQVDATCAVIEALRPVLRDHGIRVALETHADLTAAELLALVERIGDDVAAVTLDTGNLLMRLDDPVSSAELLAPWVVCTHLKDAVLAFTPRGLCWQARPIGGGGLPIPDMLAPLAKVRPEVNLSIEMHPRTYDLPIFDRSWLAYFPGLRPESLSAVVEVAWQCERAYAEGRLARPEVVEAIPWAERELDWIARSVGYLRPVMKLLSRLNQTRPNGAH
jgi:sugar phosphate isomerase/epimerase